MTDPIDRPVPPAPPAPSVSPEPLIRRKPPAMGAATDPMAAGGPTSAPRDRLLPKPLQRVLGFVILFSTVGVLSCQAFLD